MSEGSPNSMIGFGLAELGFEGKCAEPDVLRTAEYDSVVTNAAAPAKSDVSTRLARAPLHIRRKRTAGSAFVKQIKSSPKHTRRRAGLRIGAPNILQRFSEHIPPKHFLNDCHAPAAKFYQH